MSGVGNFVLIDDDALEPGNVVRHIADSLFIGQAKVEAVAELIKRRNPEAQVETRIGRIEENMDALDGLDMLVVGVDGEGPKYVINQACLDRNLAAVYAGVYERGEGGDVVIIRPYQGPCYACWAAALRDDLALTKKDAAAELDYGMIGPEGTLEAEPGLWLHVVRVAAIQADITLNELLRETEIYRAMPGNTVVLANTALEIIDGEISPPYTAVWATVERNPHCLVCGDGLQQRMAEGETPHAVSLDELIATGMVSEDNAQSEEEQS
jgi:molybdopterin/thiamine biosynthesis adenylyltransferase